MTNYLEVPEDHDVPAGPRIRIAIALLPALSAKPAPDPLVFLFGGPASFARRLAAGLSRAHVVIAPGYGHERPPDCIFQISRAFLDAPERAPDTTCVASIPPILFTGSASAPQRK